MRRLSLIISIVALSVSLYGNINLYILIEDNRQVLCSLRGDIETRYKNGQIFLEQHPKGVLGISKEDLQRSLDSQKSTIDSLSDLDCS